TFERQSKYNNINNVCLSVSPLVKLFARSKVSVPCVWRVAFWARFKEPSDHHRWGSVPVDYLAGLPGLRLEKQE
ncbi:hypothetical protein SFRURICE_006072, partial [Spodoptera frugiperda]